MPELTRIINTSGIRLKFYVAGLATVMPRQ